MSNEFRVSVASPSFSSHPVLRAALLAEFNAVQFNETGRRWTQEELASAFQRSEAMIVGLDPVTEELVAKAKHLKVVSKYGVGLDNVDLDALTAHHVRLGWTPGVNRRSVAELSLCFMLGLCRRVFFTSAQLKKGQWDRQGGVELSGKTVGVIGLGCIGKELCGLLKPFGCRILCNDVNAIDQYCQDHQLEVRTKEAIYREADVITIHTPLTDSTRGLIGERELCQMKESAYLINTSRGEVIQEEALRNALQTQVIAGAALDVYHGEPPQDQALLQLENFIGTPHIGGNANEAVIAMGRSAIAHLKQAFV